MNCSIFEDHLSDYLEAALDSRTKAECAAHRLVCRECRALYTDVRAAMGEVNELSEGEDIAVSPVLATRILAATTPGKMLSCGEFDLLIERYFDGVFLPSEFQTFQNHFDQCRQCRRLLGGIEDAIAMCREAKEESVAPADLPERIVAATSGRASGRLYAVLLGVWATLNTPQWAVALLILAAATTLFSSRFATVGDFKAEAQESAERLRAELQNGLQTNSRQARTQIKLAAIQVESLLSAPDKRNQLAPAQPTAPLLQTVDWQQALFPNYQWNVTARPVSVTTTVARPSPAPHSSPRSH
jgi:predicted anti-sigma-YlaC factor YlaD